MNKFAILFLILAWAAYRILVLAVILNAFLTNHSISANVSLIIISASGWLVDTLLQIGWIFDKR